MNQTGGQERRFFILAGEASGDHHGASLMKAMTAADPGCRFAGIGGDLMVAAGLECLVPARKMALVGVVEVIRHLPFMFKVMSRVVKFVRQWQPERVVLIDYPGFNLRLAKKLHRLGVKVTYYISPQLWAWKEGRVATIRGCVDQMLVIFPFEEQWYKDRGVQARFVGHPILEEPLPGMDREAFLASHGLDPAKPVLTLFPGSRKQELDRHLNLFLDAATRLGGTVPNLQIVVGLANTLNTDTLPDNLAPEIKVVSDHPRWALRYSDAALVASGTSTLEGAVWGVPMVIVYRMAPLTWWLLRRWVKVPYVGMANILADRLLVPEFLQERAQPEPIARALYEYFDDSKKRSAVAADLTSIKDSLAAPNSKKTPSAQAAAVILEHNER